MEKAPETQGDTLVESTTKLNALEIDPEGLARVPVGSTETTLYAEGAGPSPSNSPHYQALYFTFRFLVYVAAKSAFAVWLLFFTGSGEKNIWFVLPIIYLVYNLAKMIICLQFKARRLEFFPELGADLHFDLRYSLGMSICATGALVFLFGGIPPTRLHYFAIPHLVLSIFSYFKYRNEGALIISFPLWSLVEAFQVFFFFLRFATEISPPMWENSLIIYFYFYSFLQIFGFATAALTGLLIMVYLIRSGRMGLHERISFIAVISCGVFLSMDLVLGRRILIFFIDSLNSGALAPGPSLTAPLPEGTFGLALTMILVYGFVFLLMSCLIPVLASNRLKAFAGPHVKKISLMSFPQMLNSGYNQVSGTFFKPGGSPDPEAPIEPTQFEQENCSICFGNTSNVIIQPCGHGGYCHECLTEWAKTKNQCPLCKNPISQLLVVQVDLESRKLMTTGIIKIT